MAKNLTNQKNVHPEILSNKQVGRDLFIVAFCEKLDKRYDFKKLQVSNLKQLQRFLDLVSGQTITTIDLKYKCKSDKGDKYKGHQVQHYEVNRNFRIHGFYENKLFKVIRIDPNHKVHA